MSQEPVLFDCSIKDNIIYGIPDGERDDVTMEQVEEAAKSANIHHFISSLPQVSSLVVQNHYLENDLNDLTACCHHNFRDCGPVICSLLLPLLSL